MHRHVHVCSAVCLHAVTHLLATGKLTFTTRGKLLGTDSVGGSRRSTRTLFERISAFSATMPRIKVLRKTGVNSPQMVRMTGPPAVMYCVSIMGGPDSALFQVRKTGASAAAPTSPRCTAGCPPR